MAGGDSQVTPGNCGARASLTRLAPTLPLPPAHSTRPAPWGVEGPDRQGGSLGLKHPHNLFGMVLSGVQHLGSLSLPHPCSPHQPLWVRHAPHFPQKWLCPGQLLGTHWGPVPQGGLGHSGGSRKTDSLSLPFAHLPLPAGACTRLIDNVGMESCGSPPHMGGRKALQSPIWAPRQMPSVFPVPSFSTWGTEGLVTKSLVQTSPQGSCVT